MEIQRALGTSILTAGIGLAGLFGVGLATAAADPGQPCGQQNMPACAPNQPGGHGQGGAGQLDWHVRGIDQGRRDHKPFRYQGRQVTPMPAGDGDGWGFWFLGQWIRL